jgi:hypothetical protein
MDSRSQSSDSINALLEREDNRLNEKPFHSLKTSNSYIVLACITCETVVLLTAPRQDIFCDNGSVDNLFTPTICASCEPKDDSKSWSKISINKKLVVLWGPYLAMTGLAHSSLSKSPELDESHDGTQVRLTGRARAAQILDGEIEICSVLMNPKGGGRLEVLPYVESGFFHLG